MTIEEYERREKPEARFVKTVDKMMSKLTNTLNKGAAFKKLGTSPEEIRRHFSNQTKEYKEKYGKDFPELMEILEETMENMLKEMHV